MQGVLLICVPALYGGIQTLEMSAVLARVSGLQMGQNMTGYALQQSIYMGTRLLLVMLLPLLGLAVDSGMSTETFARMSHYSLAAAAILGVAVILLRNSLTSYYCGVLRSYSSTGRYVYSFFAPDRRPEETTHLSLSLPKNRSVLYASIAVFTVYSTGMFAAFFVAAAVPEYRASISQASGILNALGAVLLTFYVEPAISKNIDLSTEDAPKLIMALLIGRWLSVAFLGHVVLVVIFGVIE